MAAEMGEEWIDVVLDDEEPLPADLLLAIRAAPQGFASGAAADATKGLHDAVDITIPRLVKTEDIKRYLELARGNTLERLPESSEGKVRLQCTWKKADAMRKVVTIRAKEIKAHAKKKRDADNSDEEEPSDDDGGGNKRHGAEKSADKDGKSSEAKKWFVGFYGCRGDHRWKAYHAVGPIGQKERYTRLWQGGTRSESAHRGSGGEGSLPQKLRQAVGV